MDNNGQLSSLALLESLLFVSSAPTSVARLAGALAIGLPATRALLQELELSYAQRGLRLQWDGDSVQLTSAPEAGTTIEQFLGLEVSTRLSQAALELLAIVAYLQPVTRPQMDQLRGVSSDGALRSLLSKGLVAEVGRQETPGRPILYGTTPEFLSYFGLGSLAEMPALSPEK